MCLLGSVGRAICFAASSIFFDNSFSFTLSFSGATSLPWTTPQQTQRHFSATRRKIAILKAKVETLELLRLQLPASRQPITQKEMNKRKEMLEDVSSKVEQMANTLNLCSAARRDRLLGLDTKPYEIMKNAAEMDNQGVVALQRQIIKVQDEELEKLEEAVVSTKHISLAVNEELDLHTTLLDTLDDHVETTDYQLQRVQKSLAIFNRLTKGGSWSLCLAVISVVVLILVGRFVIPNEVSLVQRGLSWLRRIARGRGCLARARVFALSATVYYIWHARNACVFDNNLIPMEVVARLVLTHVFRLLHEIFPYSMVAAL